MSKAQNSETSCRAKGRAARRALGKYTSKKRWEMSESGGCFWLQEKNPVVMYGCESWTVKKAERPRIDAFELWCWRRLLRVPWTTRRSNQSILKKISPGISLEGMMLKLKLQYFGHLMRRVDSLEKTDAGRDWGQEEKGTTEDEMAGWHH